MTCLNLRAASLTLAALCWASVTHAQQVNPPLVIRQVYGGGGNSGATFTNDFVEILNVSTGNVSLSGLSIQYASATGTGNFGSSASQLTALPAFSLAPGQSFLVQEAGGATGAPLPAADAIGTINLSGTAGKVALVSSTTSLGCNGSSAPCNAAQLGLIIDLIGYGGANFFEGTGPAPTISNTQSALRGGNGCTDTNDNALDVSAAAPAPRNTASGSLTCGTTGGGGDIGACGDAATNIGAIQGSGSASPIAGSTVNVEGVVTADFRAALSGIYIQAESGRTDGDPSTSDGLFVFNPPSATLAVGNRVRVRGTVTEFNSFTELSPASALIVCAASANVDAASVTLPVSAVTDFERFEGMSVSFTQPLVVTGNFGWGRFGELDLSSGDRLFQPTNIVTPGAAAIAQQALNDRNHIVLDDLSNAQDPDPIPYKDANNTRRVGDVVPALTGVLEQAFSAYRIRATGPVTFQSANPRPAVPDVGGRLKIVSANVLNFFKTIDNGTNRVSCNNTLAPRGCNNANECTRQLQKLVNEFNGLKPDIAGLTEMENDSDSGATQLLVSTLNAAPGSPGDYDFVHTGCIGGDAIRVAMIYRTSKVILDAPFKVLDHSFDANYIDDKNRPALAQTFVEKASSAKFTLVLNHLKSKGSDCVDVSDPDTGDGQGNCNLTRTKAAQVLLNWIATDPTASHDPDFVIMGDLNSYAKEDPIAKLKSGGFKSLVEELSTTNPVSYQFDAQSGALDHALATGSFFNQVTAAVEFHSNADEPEFLDYNTEFKTDDPFNPSDLYRASDHDALVFGVIPTTTSPHTVPALPCSMGWTLVIGLLAAASPRRPRKSR